MVGNASIRATLPSFLEIIDAELAADLVELRHRPLQAALIFATEFVAEVSHGTVANPIGQPWFDVIHFEVLRWYHDRYGLALASNPTGSAHSVLSHGGHVYGLTVPLAVSRPDVREGYKWIHFPVSVRDDEDAISFLDSPPNLASWRTPELNGLREGVVTTAAAVRSLAHDLRMASRADGSPPFAEDAFWALSRSAGAIADGSTSSRGIAIWDLNFACELALKAYIRQQGVEPEWSHSLFRLYRTAVGVGLPDGLAEPVSEFPDEKSLSKYRYGQLALPESRQLASLYVSAQTVLAHTARHLSRTFTARDAALLMRLPGVKALESCRTPLVQVATEAECLIGRPPLP